MNLQEQKHYYKFYKLPNNWVDDNDKQYSDEFFNDKKYEDLYFDNFFDMDQMFGHENSLFGTRGLPVGDPKRTSKSFNYYNEMYGPMIVRVVKNKNLQEQILRIKSMMGMNEDYNPSGKKHKPNKFVYHKSPPQVRDNVSKEGLLVSVGDCYKTYSENFSKEDCIPAIFATDSDNEDEWFESTWDDDVWRINTKIADVEWFKDKHFEYEGSKNNHIVTFQDIKPEAIKLIYKGTGKSN